MNKNDKIEVIIEDIGIDGEGIGKVDGMTFFIKDALPGDHIEATVTKLKKSYGYARLLTIKEPSPYRVEAKCPVHRQCGGCQIQALAYEEQLKFKQRKVRGNLIRIGGFDEAFIDERMEPAAGMEQPYHYRNKAQFPIGRDRDGKIVAGFYAGRTHDIIPFDRCYLGVEHNEQILHAVIAYMNENQIEPYDENTGKGCVRHVLIRYGFSTKELMVCLVINSKELPHADKLIAKLTSMDGMTSISCNINREKTNVILGKETKTLWGQAYITDYIGDVKYQISPQSFYQVNPVQTEVLYGKALEYAGLTGEETVWDLYCGIGTISLFLAKKAKKVFGVEIVPQAIADAKNNAKINGITNAEFFVGKSEEILPQYVKTHEHDADYISPQVIVVDPPRKGCDETLLQTMVDMQPQRIVYVSCDSATLARDLKFLCGTNYEVQRIQAVDQFCHTVHCETVCLLTKQKEDDHIEVDLDLDKLDATSAETKGA